MKLLLKRKLAEQVRGPARFQISRLNLEGKELEEALQLYLSRFVEGILDPTIADKNPNGFIMSLQKGLLGDFLKRYILIARDQNEVVGILIALPGESRSFHIYALHVAPEYRRKGAGSALLSQCINDLTLGNATEIVLDVHAENMLAYNLYKKFGFYEQSAT